MSPHFRTSARAPRKLRLNSGCGQAEGLGPPCCWEDVLVGRGHSQGHAEGGPGAALPATPRIGPICLGKLGGLRGPSAPTRLNFRGFSSSLLQVWASSQ